MAVSMAETTKVMFINIQVVSCIYVALYKSDTVYVNQRAHSCTDNNDVSILIIFIIYLSFIYILCIYLPTY